MATTAGSIPGISGRHRVTLWQGYLARIDVLGLSCYNDDAGTQAD
jgi:hypothetical protein